MEKRLHAVVSGVVQGVFFRAFVRFQAGQLGLTGWVKNLDDGRVEVMAEGSEEKLKEFLEKLKHGPPAAVVEKVDAEWSDSKHEFKTFEKRHEY